MQHWYAIAGLSAVSLSVALAPLLRRRVPATAERAGYDIAVYRAQLAEVERDLARGLLSPDQAEETRLETKRRILAVGNDQSSGAVADRGARPLAALLAVAVVGTAVGLYARLGVPGMADLPHAQAQASRLNLAEDQSRRVGVMVGQLVARLTANPTDIAGWQMLGRSYLALGRHQDAAAAFRRAVEQGASEPETLSSFGEAVVRAEGGTVTAEAHELFVRVLRQAPQDARAHYYLGQARRQVGETAEALAIWKDLERDSAADAPWLPTLREEMRKVAAQSGLDLARVEPRHPLFGERRQAPPAATSAPNSAAAWVRLAQSHQAAGQFDKARAAYASAITLQPDDVDLRLTYADLLRSLSPAGALSNELIEVMEAVAALDPDNQEALYTLGLAAAEAGRDAEAKARWQRLLSLLPAGSPDAEVVRARLARL